MNKKITYNNAHKIWSESYDKIYDGFNIEAQNLIGYNNDSSNLHLRYCVCKGHNSTADLIKPSSSL